MRKRGIPEAMVSAVMSLYEGAKTRVRVRLELSEDFVLSPLLFATVVGCDYRKCEKWFDE